MGKPRASSEGAEPVSVAEPANDHAAPPQAGATAEAPPPTDASTAVSTAPASEPGLPSPHQNHTKNWIEKTQMDWQSFRLGHDALVSELNGLDASHDAVQSQRQADFDAESKRIADAHSLKREELMARINDMIDGLAVTEKAISHYNERVKEQNKNLRDDEQKEEQEQS